MIDNCPYAIVDESTAKGKDYIFANRKNIVNQKLCDGKLEGVRAAQ